MATELQRTYDFKVKNNTYTVAFPTVGQYMDIENMRMKLADGQYAKLMASNLVSSSKNLDLIDMFATTTILCPELHRDLKSGSFRDLDLFDSKQLLEVYNSGLRLWIESWMKIFVAVVSDDKDGEETA